MTGEADPYLISGTDVLRNLAGITDGRQLALFENESVTLRYSELAKMPLTAEGTVSQLQWIHHYLFQDVYEWAGRIRTIDMSKGGGSVFQPLRLKQDYPLARLNIIIRSGNDGLPELIE